MVEMHSLAMPPRRILAFILISILSFSGMCNGDSSGWISACIGQRKLLKTMTSFDLPYTDKFNAHHQYHHLYALLFRCAASKPIQFLEIGLGCTHGFTAMEPRMWTKALPYLTQNYLDYVDCVAKFPYVKTDVNGRIFIGDQSNVTFLSSAVISALTANGQALDVIIDDGSHQPRHQVASFTYLFPSKLLRPGGYYVIEDLFYNFHPQFNGYWDGSALDFFARLIQTFAGVGVSRSRFQPTPAVEGVEEVVCQFGICWVKKAGKYAPGSGPWCGEQQHGEVDVEVAQYSFIQDRLLCGTLVNQTVWYLVRSCDELTSEKKGALFNHIPALIGARVVPHLYEESSSCSFVPSTPDSPSLFPLVVIDEGSPSYADRMQALRRVIESRLVVGGFYFWRNTAQRSSEMADPFIIGLYSQYCEMKLKSVKYRKNAVVKKVTKKILFPRFCTFRNPFRNVFRVGCNANWCYLQVRPSYVLKQPFWEHWENFAITAADGKVFQSMMSAKLWRSWSSDI